MSTNEQLAIDLAIRLLPTVGDNALSDDLFEVGRRAGAVAVGITAEIDYRKYLARRSCDLPTTTATKTTNKRTKRTNAKGKAAT